MNKFFNNYGWTIVWALFVLFNIVSLLMLFTADVSYALIIFIPTILFLFPPLIKKFLKKTRLKKIVYFILVAIIMSLSLFSSTKLSNAKKEEQLRLNQEKKQKEDEQREAEKKAREEEAKKKAEENTVQTTVNGKKKYVAPTQSNIQNEEQSGEDSIKEKSSDKKEETKLIHANKKTKIYYTSEQRYYNKIDEKDLVTFKTEDMAKRYGYKKYVA